MRTLKITTVGSGPLAESIHLQMLRQKAFAGADVEFRSHAELPEIERLQNERDAIVLALPPGDDVDRYVSAGMLARTSSARAVVVDTSNKHHGDRGVPLVAAAYNGRNVRKGRWDGRLVSCPDATTLVAAAFLAPILGHLGDSQVRAVALGSSPRADIEGELRKLMKSFPVSFNVMRLPAAEDLGLSVAIFVDSRWAVESSALLEILDEAGVSRCATPVEAREAVARGSVALTQFLQRPQASEGHFPNSISAVLEVDPVPLVAWNAVQTARYALNL